MTTRDPGRDTEVDAEEEEVEREDEETRVFSPGATNAEERPP